MRKIYKITGIILVSALVCLNIVYADSVSLRVPSSFKYGNEDFTGRAEEAAEEIIVKFQIDSASIIGTPYRFGGFEEKKRGVYEGDLFINGERFELEVTISDEGSPDMPSFVYIYKISYGGKDVAFVSIVSWKDNESEYFVPKIQSIEVDPECGRDRIGSVKKSLEGVSLASVLMNIALKDMSLDNRTILSKVVYRDALGLLPPDPTTISLLEKFRMIPLDIDEIKKDIQAGRYLHIRGLEIKKGDDQAYPYFAIGKRSGLGYTVVMLRYRRQGISRPLSAAEDYLSNKDPDTLISIISGLHPEYAAYVGGEWGLGEGKKRIKSSKWMERYLKPVPSWQLHASKAAARSLKDYMRGWFGWFYKGWQWKETERVINTKFADNADRKKAMSIIDGLRREISKRGISIGRRDAINIVYYSNIMTFVYKAQGIKELQERCDIVLTFLSSVGFHEWWDIVIHRELTDYYFNKALEITRQYGAFQINDVKEGGKIKLDRFKKVPEAPARESRTQL